MLSCAFIVTLTLGAANVRINKVLNSGWEGVQVKNVLPKIDDPNLKWKSVELPLFKGGHSLLLRRSLNIQEHWRGMQIVLTCKFCNYRTQVWLNGEKVGDHRGGFGVFNVNLTKFIKWRKENRLSLCVSGPVLDSKGKCPDSLSYGQSWIWGVLGRLELNVFNSDHLDEVFIKPNLRQSKIDVSLSTQLPGNPVSDYHLHFSILNAAGQIIKKISENLPCKPGAAIYSLPWVLPFQWSPKTPYLYNMKIDLLKGNELRDSLVTRFGYREFYVKGPYFHLNGKRINLFGDGWHFRPWNEKKIVQLFTMLKAAGINTYRGHGPHPELWYDVADKMGMLMVAEGPTHQLYRDDVKHPDYPKNSRRTYTEWVKMIRNHPSIIIYSADNEVINGYGRGYKEDLPTDRNREKMMRNLLRLANIIRDNDNSRPIMHEGDGALDGYADIVNMHYPHEAPFWHLYPQDNLWLTNDSSSCDWKYRPWRRKKPLYIGEFGKSYDISPRGVAFIAGDAGYYDEKSYYRAYGEIIRQMIIGLRLSDCPGIAPWNTSTYGIIWPKNAPPWTNGLYDGIKSGFKHEVLFNLDYNNRFYADTTASRKLALFNDSLEDNSYEIQWALVDKFGAIATSGHKDVFLKSGFHKIFKVELKLPSSATASDYSFQAVLLKQNLKMHMCQQTIHLFPENTLPSIPSVFLYDPVNKCAKAFESAKLEYTKIKNISAARSGGVLLVAPGALDGNIANSLTAFARSGGHCIVLSQKKWPNEWLGLRFPGKAMSCTIAFARQPKHPALQSLPPDATKYWAVDNLVSNNLFLKPDIGPMRTIIDSSGNQMGIKYAALLQGQIGNGIVTCSQLNLIQKWDVEPAAALILKNLICQPIARKPIKHATLISKDSRLNQLFKDAAINVKTVEEFSKETLESKIIIIDGRLLKTMNRAIINNIKNAVEKGAVVFISEMPFDAIENAYKLVDCSLNLIKCEIYQLALLAREKFPGLSDDDLCWVVYDEWGCEYRHAHNKRWPIVDKALKISPDAASNVLMKTKPVLLGNMYGDAMRMHLAKKDFSFKEKNYPAIIEISRGKGKFIFCQIKLAGEYGKSRGKMKNGKLRWDCFNYSIDQKRRRIARGIASYLNIQ